MIHIFYKFKEPVDIKHPKTLQDLTCSKYFGRCSLCACIHSICFAAYASDKAACKHIETQGRNSPTSTNIRGGDRKAETGNRVTSLVVCCLTVTPCRRAGIYKGNNGALVSLCSNCLKLKGVAQRGPCRKSPC